MHPIGRACAIYTLPSSSSCIHCEVHSVWSPPSGHRDNPLKEHQAMHSPYAAILSTVVARIASYGFLPRVHTSSRKMTTACSDITCNTVVCNTRNSLNISLWPSPLFWPSVSLLTEADALECYRLQGFRTPRMLQLEASFSSRRSEELHGASFYRKEYRTFVCGYQTTE